MIRNSLEEQRTTIGSHQYQKWRPSERGSHKKVNPKGAIPRLPLPDLPTPEGAHTEYGFVMPPDILHISVAERCEIRFCQRCDNLVWIMGMYMSGHARACGFVLERGAFHTASRQIPQTSEYYGKLKSIVALEG